VSACAAEVVQVTEPALSGASDRRGYQATTPIADAAAPVEKKLRRRLGKAFRTEFSGEPVGRGAQSAQDRANITLYLQVNNTYLHIARSRTPERASLSGR